MNDIPVPMKINWQIGDLMEYRGKQELFTRQVPQKLKALREHALIESAVSSNRIEGVQVDQKRIKTLIFGASAYRSRDEEEVAGYRMALNLIHSEGAGLSLSEETVLRFHRLSRGDIWDAGKYKNKPVDIVEILPNGDQVVRFRSVSPEQTPDMTRQSFELMDGLRSDSRVHPLILLGALNLDFLCIHPFRDGNGRVSRLLLLQTCYHLGFDAGRYISLERIIEQNKERYYETLQLSSQGWHDGKHDPWPYIGYLLFILKQACREFEERVGQIQAPRGGKMEMVIHALQGMPGEFTLQQLEAVCSGVGRDWIQSILGTLKQEGKVSCTGRGRGARWKYHAE
ncbi:MAG: Fic family protein [Candidatus Aegiribacteria sp.]|nr:Fic family protein [Candidatus Aegiribacteria sp.]